VILISSKKDDIWTKITCNIKCESYNLLQHNAEKKMKYTKKYIKKIDIMGPKNGGAAPLK